MTNQQILEKAIAKAIAGGWEFDNLDKWQWSAIKKTDTVMNNWYYFLITYDGKEKFIDAERIIYDHDFARALWGEELGNFIISGYDGEARVRVLNWQAHLQQMVIAKDPIKYLGDNLD